MGALRKTNKKKGRSQPLYQYKKKNGPGVEIVHLRYVRCLAVHIKYVKGSAATHSSVQPHKFKFQCPTNLHVTSDPNLCPTLATIMITTTILYRLVFWHTSSSFIHIVAQFIYYYQYHMPVGPDSRQQYSCFWASNLHTRRAFLILIAETADQIGQKLAATMQRHSAT